MPAAINPARILYEDDDLVVVNKLAGELVVAASGIGKLPLVDFLRKKYPGIRTIHRLDYQTSGVIVFAKNKEAAEKIRESKFAGWKKTYRAIVAGYVEKKEGDITKPLPARTHEGLVKAITHYRVLFASPFASMVEAQIDTGRKHQIRQHFQHIHHPLVLDPLYGNKKMDTAFRKRFKFAHFFLHAYKLDFPHPITGKMIHVSAALPQSFEKLLKMLRNHN